MAVHRDVFERIRGLDERMHTYGGEDIDFATRARRAGQKLLWVDRPDVRMYHMWHPSSRVAAEATEESKAAVAANKEIVYKDKSVVRNTRVWNHRLTDAGPLVTVAIATRNRSQFLGESITSVLGQTVQDFEIVVVDDGSTDDTEEVVAGFADPRIRYFRQEQAGVAAARNRAATEARGYYTAVHDDDDLMTPWRLESQLNVLDVGLHGSFGSFVNFDNSSGKMVLFRSKALNAGTIDESGGAPGHGTWLVETEIIRQLGYDESLSSGVDNNLALRIVRSGFKMVHCGEILMLRRMHPGQITTRDEHMQKLAARQTRLLFSFMTTAWGSKKMKEQRGPADWSPIRFADQLEELEPFLPDHLVERVSVARMPEQIVESGVSVHRDGEYIGRFRADDRLTLRDLARLTSCGEQPSMAIQRRYASVEAGEHAKPPVNIGAEARIRLTAIRMAEDLQERTGGNVWVLRVGESSPDHLVKMHSMRFESDEVCRDFEYFVSEGRDTLPGQLASAWDRLEFSQLSLQMSDAAGAFSSVASQHALMPGIGERP